MVFPKEWRANCIPAAMQGGGDSLSINKSKVFNGLENEFKKKSQDL